MRLGFGTNFRAARHSWLYEVREGQPWWVAILLAFAGFVVLSILQMVSGIVVFVGLWLAGDPAVTAAFSADMVIDPAAYEAAFMRALVLGIAPAAAVSAFIVWWFAGLNNPDPARRLPLQRPHLGVLGWLTILVGFAILIYTVFFGTFYVLGIDPATYQPSADGLKDTASNSGMIEKTMADLARSPLLYAAALPGIAIFTPLVEELIFRGALFNAVAGLGRRFIAGKAAGNILAVLLTSAVWSVVHAATAPWLFVFVIFLMGLILGTLLLRFGSLWVTIACHALWNSLTALSIFNIPGLQ